MIGNARQSYLRPWFVHSKSANRGESVARPRGLFNSSPSWLQTLPLPTYWKTQLAALFSFSDGDSSNEIVGVQDRALYRGPNLRVHHRAAMGKPTVGRKTSACTSMVGMKVPKDLA
jgi:hypothetical protein